jgi:HD-GYP domain-containing protein (c-di-GMP phosphodiesterase class II)
MTATLETMGPELLVQLVRTLRIALIHDLDNEAVARVSDELRGLLDHQLGELQTVGLQCVSGQVYFNREFIRLKGPAYDAAIQAKKIFGRLHINEILFTGSLSAPELAAFLEAFRAAYTSPDPTELARVRFDRITVRPLDSSLGVGIDQKAELARTYAQLVVLVQDARVQIGERKQVPLARIRRAAQQLAQASEGLDDLLVGLTRFDNPDGDRAMHAVAVASLAIVMARRIGAARRDLIGLCLSAIFAELGDGEHLLETILAIARISRSDDALDRVSTAYEAHLVESGQVEGLRPGVPAQLIAVASAFDSLTQPPPDRARVRPDQAVRILSDRAEGRFDRGAVRLFTSVVGLYPIGSLVRLSTGQTAVVLSSGAGRPTVKVIEEREAPADYVIELEAEPGIQVAECLDARERRVPVTHFLLA